MTTPVFGNPEARARRAKERRRRRRRTVPPPPETHLYRVAVVDTLPSGRLRRLSRKFHSRAGAMAYAARAEAEATRCIRVTVLRARVGEWELVAKHVKGGAR
jgi:hypothetical protein